MTPTLCRSVSKFSAGNAAHGTGEGQCEVPSRGKEENGMGVLAEQGRVAESQGLAAKPQWVYASLLALSTLLWRSKVPAHEYASCFRDKEKFTDVTLDDVARVMDSDAADTEVWCVESMNDEEIDRLNAFILAIWTFTVTSLSAYRGKRGLDPKGAADHREAEDDEPRLPARSQGC